MTELYRSEIAEQPAVIAKIAGRFASEYGEALAKARHGLLGNQFDRVIITGMGGSLHSTHAALITLTRALTTPVLLWDAAELTQQVPQLVNGRSAIIAVSQSGESAELCRLTELADRPGLSISLTNGADNALANWADVAITTAAGPESTASTKTYTAGFAALHLAVAHLIGQSEGSAEAVRGAADTIAGFLPALPRVAEEAAAFLGPVNALVFVGRGASYASAAMGALLTEEAAKLTCQPLTGGQFRHGPLELVRSGFSAVIFAGEGEAAELNFRLAQDTAGLGGRCIVIGDDLSRLARSENLLPVTLPEVGGGLLPLTEILPIQHLAIPLAIARGFEPAAFLNASKVTRLQ